jgi:hypothetical protein
MPSLNPVGKVVHLCDDVARDPATGKTHFLGIFDDVVPPANAVFPFRLAVMCVVAQLTGSLGRIPVHLEIVEGTTGQQVRRAGPFTLNFVHQQQVVTVCIRVRDCPFPSAGVYFVEFFVGGLFLDDRRLRVR